MIEPRQARVQSTLIAGCQRSGRGSVVQQRETRIEAKVSSGAHRALMGGSPVRPLAEALPPPTLSLDLNGWTWSTIYTLLSPELSHTEKEARSGPQSEWRRHALSERFPNKDIALL